MIFIFELLIFVSSQLSLYPIEGQLFYYGLGQNSEGFVVSIEGETLGFKIQNGISESRIHNLNIPQGAKIVSTSMYEQGNYFALLFLTNENVYQVQLNYLGYDQTIKLSNTYNISRLNCTSFVIIDETTILTNCFNKSGELIYILTKNGVSTAYQTQIIMDTSSLKKISWQNQYGHHEAVYAIYIHHTHSIIYKLKVNNSDIYELTKFWKYDEEFIQIHVTNTEESNLFNFYVVLALSQTKLMYTNKITTILLENLSKNNFISMDVYRMTNNILQIALCDQERIYIYQFRFYFNLIGSALFISSKKQASLYVDEQNLFVVSESSMLFYNIDTNLKLAYYYDVQAYSDFNQFNFFSQYLITVNQTQYQLFQINKPYIYCENPQESGDLNIVVYEPQNKTFQSLGKLPVQVQQKQTFWNIIHISKVELIKSTIQGFDSLSLNLDKFIGPNQSFALTNNDQFQYYFIQPVLVQYYKASYIISCNVEDLRSNLIIQKYKDLISVNLLQYDYLKNQTSNIWQKTFVFNHRILGMSLQNDFYDRNLIKLYIVSIDYLHIYNINLLTQVKLYGAFNITPFFNKSGQVYVNQLILKNYLYICYSNQIIVIRVGKDIKAINQLLFENITYIATNYKMIMIIEHQTLMFYYINNSHVKPIIQYQPKLTQNDCLYIFPTLYGSFILEGQLQNWKLLYLDQQNFKQTIVGKFLMQEINIDGYDFSKQIFAYTSKNFYAIVLYQGQQYLNVYRSSFYQQNFLYYSIHLGNIDINTIEVSKDFYQLYEYATIMLKDNQVQLYIIPLYVDLNIYPKFSLQSTQNTQSQISVCNQFSSYNVSLQIDIELEYLSIQVENSTKNLSTSNNQQEIQMDLISIFKGAIQNYTLECDNCLDFRYKSVVSQNILINGSFNFINYNHINGFKYLYLGQSKFINQYKINEGQNEFLQIGEPQIQYQATNQQQIIYTFLEINTLMISWITRDKDSYKIYSIIGDTQYNIMLHVKGFISSINYQDGFLQIATINYYYCFTYLIENQEQKLYPIVENLEIQQTKQFQNPFIILYKNETFIRFGTLLMSSANTVISIFINAYVTKYNHYEMTDFSIYSYFNEFLCLKCSIHSIIQIGSFITQQEWHTQGILLFFTTDLTGKGKRIVFDGFDVQSSYLQYTLVMINSTKLNAFHNILATNGQDKIVILNSNSQNEISFINFYNIVTNSSDHQTILPYYYINTTSQSKFDSSLTFINPDQLIICQNNQVQLIEQQSQISIKYKINQNATMRLIAQNQYSNATYLINLQFDQNEPQNPKPQIDNTKNWQRMLIIFTALVFILLTLVKSFLYFRKLRFQEQYRNVEDMGIEIRIRDN